MSGFHPYYKSKLPSELAKKAEEIIEMGQDFGLSHYPIKFVLVDPKQLNAVAAYTGFPSRMPHWKWGRDFEDVHKRYTYGAAKIYELVINTNPVIAYLLSTNTFMDQKLVMIHVCGHADFFYNNDWFAHTNREMLDQMANNASRVRRIMNRKGHNRVEDFMDVCFSLENLIDPYMAYIKRSHDRDPYAEEEAKPLPRLKAKAYMEDFINPENFIEMQKRRRERELQKRRHFPEDPDRDVLGFLVKHAKFEHGEHWKRDVLAMTREEAYYFAPQRMTKILNEGWATYIHSHFMAEQGLADHSEIIDYCDSQSRALAVQPGGLNPYRLGLHLLKDVEDRWNKGRFGPEWDRCTNMEERANWDKKLGLGRDKLFSIRKTCNDVSFIDHYITPEFALEEKLYSWKPNPLGFDDYTNVFKEVKTHLLTMLANGGEPIISVTNGDYQKRGELLLEHSFDGRELDKGKVRDTLQNLYKIWQRPVHVRTEEIQDEGDQETRMVQWTYTGPGPEGFVEEYLD